MGFWLTLRVAWRALAKNKLRAGLTVLGVVIGIAAVTTMVSIGEGAKRLVLGEFEAFGTNMLVIFPKVQDRGGVRQSDWQVPTLTAEDCDAMVSDCPSVIAASPIMNARGQAVYGNSNWQPQEIIGVAPGYQVIRKLKLRQGSFIAERDVASAAAVCVIGETIVRQLFQTENPIGKTIRVANIPFEIIGVLEASGTNMFGADQDDLVLMPHTTVLQRIYQSPFRFVGAAFASAVSPDRMQDAEAEIRQLLLSRHRIPPGASPDFELRNSKEIAQLLTTVTRILTLLLASIASISLLVGGVGIMNIMLVSVTERTREIGIRMAIGARGRDILRQFLVESVLLSTIGGLIGFALGVGASWGAAQVINQMMTTAEWPLVVSLPAAAMAIAFSAVVGMFFGFYPARRASRLDPIEALRYE